MTEGGAPIPVTVIAGYLGAGKTTLVNHLLRHSTGRRIGVVVNDFGELDIDAALIEAAGGDAISLANGCICCSLAEGLHTALAQLRDAEPPPDHVLIEASGVALPRSIAAYAGGRGFRLDGVIVVVDAEQVLRSVKDRYVGETVLTQLESADLFILNKTDLAALNDTNLEGVRELLSRARPAAPIFGTVGASVPLEVLVGARREATPAGGTAAEVAGHGDLETVAFVSPDPVSIDDLQHWLDELPAGVLRAKGLVLVDGDDPVMVIQAVGARRRLEPAGTLAAGQESRLLVIALPGTKVPSPFGVP